MLGRTRPASPFLLWPRSTWAVRFTTTSATPSHEATAEPENVENDVASPPKRTFAGIRKLDPDLRDPAVVCPGTYTIRWMKRSTEPNPQVPGAKLEKALGEVEASATRQLVNSSGHHERGPQAIRGENRLSGASVGANVETKTPVLPRQWKPFTLNPDFAVNKPSSSTHVPTLSNKPFTLNPEFAAKGQSPPAQIRTSPSSLSPPKKDVEPAQTKDGAPTRSDILGEMSTWNYEIPATKSEPPSEEPDAVPEDGAPPRSKVIGEMKAWSFEAPSVVEADTGNQEALPKPPSKKRGKNTEELPPLDHEFREWLITATETAVEEAERNRPNTNNLAVYDGPTVLVLNGASRSLLESDFYRLARQGKHLGDWAVGITRIIQARDPATYEPLGKYYIFFHTRTAALAYREAVWQLHQLSRKAAHLISATLSSSDSIPGPLPLAPALAVGGDRDTDIDAALRGYTLLPHSARPDLKVHLCKDLPIPAEDRLSTMNQHLGPSPSAYTTQHHFVLINLEGCKTTVAALHDAIARDGEERRLPWGVATRHDGRPSIAAVVPDDGAEDPGGRFWRFVVPFAEAAEARRFVRNWHRREMPDLEGRNMVVLFNVTALW